MDKARFKQRAEDGDSERPSAHTLHPKWLSVENGDISGKGSYLICVLLP